ncbi:hypothetical protein HAX54_023719 [Datura stramonium]|uniref:Uncharacterized protein n=1 Tax=Datura stramonium TaxID=4076 RepID=A0ABS8UYV8_DATST|nr:hypothetical protein [Datura stramonium]
MAAQTNGRSNTSVEIKGYIAHGHLRQLALNGSSLKAGLKFTLLYFNVHYRDTLKKLEEQVLGGELLGNLNILPMERPTRGQMARIEVMIKHDACLVGLVKK